MTYLEKQLYEINGQIGYIQGLTYGLTSITEVLASKEGYESFRLGDALSEHIAELSQTVTDLIKTYERNG